MNTTIFKVDYLDQQQGVDLGELLNSYAEDPMGGGKPLPEKIKNNLALALSKQSNAFSVIAYIDKQAAGLVNCFLGFSTFQCKPLINVHDVFVKSNFRGLKLSQKMLQEVGRIGLEKNCCKITLEVLQGNIVAQKAYQKFGFTGYQLDPSMGKALFWEKSL